MASGAGSGGGWGGSANAACDAEPQGEAGGRGMERSQRLSDLSGGTRADRADPELASDCHGGGVWRGPAVCRDLSARGAGSYRVVRRWGEMAVAASAGRLPHGQRDLGLFSLLGARSPSGAAAIRGTEPASGVD